jgi:hypothetical protein
LERIVQSAPRLYHIVVLSDHGQSQGDTFEQRNGETLGALVTRLSGSAVTSVEQPVEQYSRVRALAEDLAGGGIGSTSAARAASRLDAAPSAP